MYIYSNYSSLLCVTHIFPDLIFFSMLWYPAISDKVIFSTLVEKMDCYMVCVIYKDETDTLGTNVIPIQIKSYLKDSDLNWIV